MIEVQPIITDVSSSPRGSSGSSSSSISIKCSENPGPMVYHASAVVDDKLYVLLGLRSIKSQNDKVFVLDLQSKKWSCVEARGRTPSQRCLASCTAVGPLIYCFGGYQIVPSGSHKCFNGMYIFDTRTLSWTHVDAKGLAPEPRAGASMVYWNRRLWVYGGSQGRHIFYGDLYSFDITTNTWKTEIPRGIYPQRRTCHTAVLLPGTAQMFIFGGITANDEQKNQMPSSDLLRLNLERLEWRKEVAYRSASSMQNENVPKARCCHAMVALDQRFLLVACGGDLMPVSQSSASAFGPSQASDASAGGSSVKKDMAEEYDNGIFVYDTQNHEWQKLKLGSSGRTLPHCLGLSMNYDTVEHQIIVFGGKIRAGTPLNSMMAIRSTGSSVPSVRSRTVSESISTLMAQATTGVQPTTGSSSSYRLIEQALASGGNVAGLDLAASSSVQQQRIKAMAAVRGRGDEPVEEPLLPGLPGTESELDADTKRRLDRLHLDSHYSPFSSRRSSLNAASPVAAVAAPGADETSGLNASAAFVTQPEGDPNTLVSSPFGSSPSSPMAEEASLLSHRRTVSAPPAPASSGVGGGGAARKGLFARIFSRNKTVTKQ